MTRPGEQDHEPPEAKAQHVQSQLLLKQRNFSCTSVIFQFALLAEGVLVQNTFRFICAFFAESVFGIHKCMRIYVYIFFVFMSLFMCLSIC